MSGRVVADTGPLVAFLDRGDRQHAWAKERMDGFFEPLSTCDAVLAESAFLLQRGGISAVPLLQLVERGILRVDFDTNREAGNVEKLLHRYRTLPMSFADACLVRMSELVPQTVIWTLDGHFRIYRRNRRNRIECLFPTV